MSEEEKYKQLYNKALSDLVKADKRNIEKDKIIEAMAGYIAMGDIEEDICQNIKNDNCDKMSFGECESCIIQYFENKVNSREEKEC